MKTYGFLIVFGLAILACAGAAMASEAGSMTYEQTVNYIQKQIGEHGAAYPSDPYQTGSKKYSFDNYQIAETTETSGKNGWVHRTVVTLRLAYLGGCSVSGGKLSLTAKENTGGVMSAEDHRSVNGRESHETGNPDKLVIEFDDYEVARRVGNAIRHLADLCNRQAKLNDNDPFR